MKTKASFKLIAVLSMLSTQVLISILASTANADTGLKGFGVIREFGDTDTAAMFGLLPPSGTIQITSCSGPAFLVANGCRVGQFNQVAMDHLFLKSANPMSQQERQDLVSQWSGAQVLYFEGYSGNLCTDSDIEYDISVTGTVNDRPFTTTFQFIALPNTNGDCTFHIFGTLTQSQGPADLIIDQ